MKKTLTTLLIILISSASYAYSTSKYDKYWESGKAYIYKGESFDMAIRFLGERDGIYQVINDRSSFVDVYNCKKPCINIDSFRYLTDTKKIENIETFPAKFGLVISSVLDDAIKGNLNQYIDERFEKPIWYTKSGYHHWETDESLGFAKKISNILNSLLGK